MRKQPLRYDSSVQLTGRSAEDLKADDPVGIGGRAQMMAVFD